MKIFNEPLPTMKRMHRAMRFYVLMLYEMILESAPDYVLEIGVRQAQSTRTILCALRNNRKGKLVSVDIGDRSDRVPEDLRPYWISVVGDSHKQETLDKVRKICPSYDFFLIDGDHTYEGVKQDFEMYSPLVRDKHLILLHDIINTHTGVPEFWKEIRYSKVPLNYGKAQGGNVPVGMGIVYYDKEV